MGYVPPGALLQLCDQGSSFSSGWKLVTIENVPTEWHGPVELPPSLQRAREGPCGWAVSRGTRTEAPSSPGKGLQGGHTTAQSHLHPVLTAGL